MKTLKWILSFVAILGTVFVLASCAETINAQDDTYLTVDINPSVELIVNRNEKVVYANPLNEDAEVLLASIELIGLDLDDALDLVIQTAIELGYIDVEADESYVYVSAISKDSELGEKIKNQAKEHINNAFGKRKMMGRAEDKGFTPEFLLEAETYGVTPGFLFLAKEATLVNDDLLLEDALLMTVDELQAILKEAKVELREVSQALKDEFLQARQVLFDQYLPQITALEAEITLKQEALATLNASLLEKQEALLEATEETKIALEAEIAIIEADVILIQTEISEIQLQVEALQVELRDAVKVIRDEFHEASQALRDEFKAMFQNRRNQNQNRVNQFFENREKESGDLIERIKNWKKGRP